MFMNILTAGVFTVAFTACSDDLTDSNAMNGNEANIAANNNEKLLEPLGLVYTDFINDNDVTIQNADTTEISVSKAYADSLLTGGTLPKEATKGDGTTAFSNDPTKVDTVFIGRFNFPVNYSGLGEDYYPSLHVTSPISVFNSTQLATYSRDVRIAAILLRPVELDEFEAKNK
jgi:hypothetical protein